MLPSLAFVAFMALLKPVVGDGVEDDVQVFFNQEKPTNESTIVGELSDLLQSSIWLEDNKTDSAEAAKTVATHCVRGNIQLRDPQLNALLV
jgi:hypothetical protein